MRLNARIRQEAAKGAILPVPSRYSKCHGENYGVKTGSGFQSGDATYKNLLQNQA
jgi:hypothetical protein